MSLSGQSRLSTTNINHRKAPPQRRAGGGGNMPITLSPSHSPRWVSTRSFWRTTQDRTPCNTDTSFYRTNITTHDKKDKFYLQCGEETKSAVEARNVWPCAKEKGGAGEGEKQGHPRQEDPQLDKTGSNKPAADRVRLFNDIKTWRS